jgi:hypothetical protein
MSRTDVPINTTITLLQRIGEALYGPRWQTDLSRDIGVADRTIRRWIADPSDIPDGAWQDILSTIERRAVEVDDARNVVSDYLKGRSRALHHIANAKLDAGLGHFALITDTGKIVNVYIGLSVFNDRVGNPTHSRMRDYFERHFEAFRAIAQRKYIVDDVLDNGAVSIGASDVRRDDPLPDERIGGFQTQVYDQPKPGPRRT